MVCKIAWRQSWFVEFNFSDQDYICLNPKIYGVEGNVAQTIIEEEGAEGVRGGLTELEVQPILSGAICSDLLAC